MKKLIQLFSIITAFLLLSVIANAQAQIGFSEYDIKNKFPTKVWVDKVSPNTGIKYISTDMELGNFTYYFDKETGLCIYCMQIPFNLTALNNQVDIYNKNYVITSDTSWTAYLEGGKIMYITLTYDSNYKISSFEYTSVKPVIK